MEKQTIVLGKGLGSANADTRPLGYRYLNIYGDHASSLWFETINPTSETEISVVKIDFDQDYEFFLSEDDALALSFILFDIVEARKKSERRAMQRIRIEKTTERMNYLGCSGTNDLIVSSEIDKSHSPSGFFIKVFPEDFDDLIGLHLTETEALELAFALFDLVGKIKPELVKTEE